MICKATEPSARLCLKVVRQDTFIVGNADSLPVKKNKKLRKSQEIRYLPFSSGKFFHGTTIEVISYEFGN
jgi:hypothetical protein